MHRIGPAVVLGLAVMPYFTRVVRASMLETLQLDFVKSARAKGLSKWAVAIRHVLRNSWVPVVVTAGPLLAMLVTGSFVIETIFNIPGLGPEFVSSVQRQNTPMVLGTTVVLAGLIIVANLVVDVLHHFLDPRIRSS